VHRRFEPAEPVAHAAVPQSLRSEGRLDLSFRRRGRATVIGRSYQSGCTRMRLPRAEAVGEPPAAVLINTAGGLAEGDVVDHAISWEAGARAIVTSQAAEKVYRALREGSRIALHMEVAAGAHAEWLPQETILFDGARFRRETRVSLAADARLLAAEIVVFGRTARGERIAAGHYLDRWRIAREGRLVWADALGWTDEPTAALAHPAGFAGAIATATVVYAGPDAAGLLDAARGALAGGAGPSGVTCVNGLLVARFLASDAQRLRSDLARLWCTMRAKAANLPARLPRTWYT